MQCDGPHTSTQVHFVSFGICALLFVVINLCPAVSSCAIGTRLNPRYEPNISGSVFYFLFPVTAVLSKSQIQHGFVLSTAIYLSQFAFLPDRSAIL